MNLKVESNAYVKLENMEKVSNVDVLIGEYTFNDYILKGEIVLKGNYYTSNIFLDENNESVSFENTIPFEVVFFYKEIKAELRKYFYMENTEPILKLSIIFFFSFIKNYNLHLFRKKCTLVHIKCILPTIYSTYAS